MTVAGAEPQKGQTMKYALLVYETDQDLDDRTCESRREEYWAGYRAYTESVRDRMTGGAALQGIDTATTVRLRDGERRVEDGPFADTKERLGGFYMIEAENLDEALEHAARCPSASTGSVEVRPVLEM